MNTVENVFGMFVFLRWFLCVFSLLVSASIVMARPQTTNDIVAEVISDFKVLRQQWCYGRLAGDSREKAEFDQLVTAAAQKRIGVWESYAIHGKLPPPLENCGKLYLELSPDISARLLAKRKGAEKLILIPSLSKGRFTDRSVFVGDVNDGLLFLYTIVYGRMYTLLNPNGIQTRVYFRLLPDFPLPREEAAGGNGGSPANSPPAIKSSGGPYFQDGWYVCTNFPSGFRHRAKETRLYLFLNSHTDLFRQSYCAYPIFFGDGNYFVDLDRWRHPDFMDKQWGPFGVYAATPNSISFDMPPPSREELSGIRFYGAVSLGKSENTIIHLAHELINSEKIFSDLFPKWVEDGPDARKLHFSKTDAPGITTDNIRFMLKDEEFWDKNQAEDFVNEILPEGKRGKN